MAITVAAATAEDEEVTKPALTTFEEIFEDDTAGDGEVSGETAEEEEAIRTIRISGRETNIRTAETTKKNSIVINTVRPLILQPIATDPEPQGPQNLKKDSKRVLKFTRRKSRKKLRLRTPTMKTIRIRKTRRTDLTPAERLRYRKSSFDKGHCYTSKRKLRNRYRPGHLYRGRLRFVQMDTATKVKTL